jgi:FdhD protein
MTDPEPIETQEASLPAPSVAVNRLGYRHGIATPGERTVPEETAVSMTYNRSSHAVMMATPADLEDFAVGFSLSEGIVERASQVTELEIVAHTLGVEARMWLAEDRMEALNARRRNILGPSGCGLCGLDSLEAAMRRPVRVTGDIRLSAAQISEAMAALYPAQALNRATSAVHGAGFWHPERGLVALREDLGRHNALDKLVGALARARVETSGGAVLLTSRVSVEMVQKAAVLGAPVLVAVSAPSALAIRTAQAAGITLVAVARGDGFEVFTHGARIEIGGEIGHVA